MTLTNNAVLQEDLCQVLQIDDAQPGLHIRLVPLGYIIEPQLEACVHLPHRAAAQLIEVWRGAGLSRTAMAGQAS